MCCPDTIYSGARLSEQQIVVSGIVLMFLYSNQVYLLIYDINLETFTVWQFLPSSSRTESYLCIRVYFVDISM